MDIHYKIYNSNVVLYLSRSVPFSSSYTTGAALQARQVPIVAYICVLRHTLKMPQNIGQVTYIFFDIARSQIHLKIKQWKSLVNVLLKQSTFYITLSLWPKFPHYVA